MNRKSLMALTAFPLLGAVSLAYAPASSADFQRNFDVRVHRGQEVVPASGAGSTTSTTTPTPTTVPGGGATPTPTTAPGQGSTSTQQFVPADITGSGNARFVLQFNTAVSRAQFILTLNNIQNVTAAHLHCGRAGENGPVVVPLITGGNPNRQNVSGSFGNGDIVAGVDCTSIIGRPINNVASLLAAIHEGLVYINVHNQQNPDGYARAQLFPGAEWSTLFNTNTSGGGLTNNGNATTTPGAGGSTVTTTPAATNTPSASGNR